MGAVMEAGMYSTARPRVLPDAWITRLFKRIEALYGSKFLDMWRGTDMENMKATWAEKLGGFADQPDALRGALEALDSRPWPPTLPEFIILCRESAARCNKTYAALPAPDVSPEVIEQRVAEIATASRKPEAYDHLASAKALRKRYLSGEKLILCQINLASKALGEVWANGAVSQAVRVRNG